MDEARWALAFELGYSAGFADGRSGRAESGQLRLFDGQWFAPPPPRREAPTPARIAGLRYQLEEIDRKWGILQGRKPNPEATRLLKEMAMQPGDKLPPDPKGPIEDEDE